MSDNTCIFCKIVQKEIPSKIVFENEDNLAFLDINPITEGHTIVIPKKHYNTLEDLPDDEVFKLFQVVKKVATLLHEKLNIDGYNIVQNNFKAAGQEINHSHVHIIPRTLGDMKFKLSIPKTSATSEELDRVLSKIQS
ncbi:MAG: HIT family protein [Promethearchaeota archaeon]